jgi:transcriptional regulator with XRE-family HTH domain
LIESGARRQRLPQHLRLLRALVKHVKHQEAAEFYQLWNDEMPLLGEWIRKRGQAFEVRLPDDVTLDSAVCSSPAGFIPPRLARLGMPQSELARELSLPTRSVWDLLHARVTTPKLDLIAKLAPPLQVDPSFLYLLFHPELPSFLMVIEAGSAKSYRRPTAERFAEASRPRSDALTDEQAAIFGRLGLSPRARYRETILKHLHRDAARDEVFILLPSEKARREALQWNLRAMLAQRLRSASMTGRTFYNTSQMSETAFRNVDQGRSIPSEGHLRFMAKTLEVREECILYRVLSRRRSADRLVVRIAGVPE